MHSAMEDLSVLPSSGAPSSSYSAAAAPAAAPALSPLPPLSSPLFKEPSSLLHAQEDSFRTLEEQRVEEEQEEARDGMGQAPSQSAGEIALLQQQLKVAARRMSVGSGITDGVGLDGAGGQDGDGTRRPRSSSLRGANDGSAPRRPRLADTKRPSSYYEGQKSFETTSDDYIFLRRRSATPPPSHASQQAEGGPSSRPHPSSPATPSTSKIRSFSASPKRASPRPSLGPALRAFKTPFLSSIPASPASPPAFMTRSHSSPPLLPSFTPPAPISPVELCFTPPTAGLDPSSKTQWPSVEQQSVYEQPSLSLSAPNLLATIVAESPIPNTPLEPVELDENPEEGLESLLGEVEHYAGVGREEKRFHALLELVETETVYLDRLRTLVKVYFQTLPFLPMLSTVDIEAVVRNSEALLELHERIVGRLQQVEAEIGWQAGKARTEDLQERKVRKAAGRVARIFVDELPNFTLYSEFCARHSEAVDIIRAIAGRPEWEAYERQCASRARSSSSGDQTPLATQSTTSPFFASTPTLTSSTPTLVGSPPTSPTLVSQRDPSTLPPLPASPVTTLTNLPPTLPRSKLRYADYAISPVQRICRYPLVFGAVLQNLDHGEDREDVEAAWEGLKGVAEGVDEAKRQREGELRTKVVAARMEFLPSISSAFCDVLGPTLLVGTLHFLHRSLAPEALRVKYYGCFLYRSHLIVGKIKKRESYEPREWLPLRLFELTNVEDGEGLLPHSIRLSYRDHHFDLGATCALEKVVWLSQLTAAQVEAHRTWEHQEKDVDGQATLFDETLVSSVSAAPSPTLNTIALPRRTHARSSSTPSMSAVVDRSSPSHGDNSSPIVPESPIIPALPQLVATASHASTHSHADSKRHRISTTTSSLLGKAPAAQRAAIDLRLSDVFSEQCLSARAQTMRESETLRLARGGSSSGTRTRTMSGPKRSMTAQAQASVRMLAKEKRRMSCIDLGTIEAQMMDYRGAVGFDADASLVYHEPSGQKWGSSMRRGKGSGKSRPVLPEIDTKLAETMKKSGTWGSKALRRAASHSSLHGRPSPASLIPTTPSTSLAADIERNNSVSSTASSSGTGTNSSSSHSHGLIIGGSSAYSNETPPSSIPPSPDLHTLDLEQLNSKLPVPLSTSAPPHSPRWGSQALSDGVASVFKVRRRGSSLGLGTGLVPPSFTDEEKRQALVTPVIASQGLQRRTSTKLGGFFSKRVQSSPTLSNLFSSNSSSPQPSGGSTSSRRANLTSASTPHLGIPAPSSPPNGEPPSPAFSELGLASSRSSATGDSGASSPDYALYTTPRKPRISSKGALEKEAMSSTTTITSSTPRAFPGASATPTFTSRNKSVRNLFRLTPIN
ncbi:hypothetical protein BCR35DRAFT_299256 [Leucosporidium creatinivorum]|uniref:DH domain-containing protein n=1 Tax=Leucosporidium creatinivorum TaxID=106004 RepID=A0A1Y2G1A7_9BASI|nr:hypothetical protein BCR35DRAFT_299256 [Leucosporidium creatinivorum]